MHLNLINEKIIQHTPILVYQCAYLFVRQINEMERSTMTNELQKMFNYAEQQVRTVVRDGKPWFIAKDVYDILEVENNRQVLSRLDDDEKQTVILNDTLSRNPKTQVVNEAGLYTLIIGSRKPEAKAFKRWITHDIIPSIRKNGAYITENTLEQAISDPNFMIELLTSLKEEKAKRIEMEKENKVLIRYNEILMMNLEGSMPKAEKYEAFLDTDELTTLTIVGKHFLGGMSPVALRKFLQAEGVVLFNRKVDCVYAPRKGYEKYFSTISYTNSSYHIPKII
ncbi:hypothetical protein COM22_11940 [Bacillus wiedmannii]|nr:hypothetical protein COL51_14080 [Bacillus wiedmannii]PGC57407.1 hypothetical protein COM22_11940 [Bacillus wiedmannii]